METKVDWESVTFLGFIGVIVSILAVLIWWSIGQGRLYDACQETCGVYKSRVIDQNCYCATEDGWKKK